MKKLKNFQKFALSNEQANSVKGGYIPQDDDKDKQTFLTCNYNNGDQLEFHASDFGGTLAGAADAALSFCSGSPSCTGCF